MTWTYITYDNGHSWNNMKHEDKPLHLHSYSSLSLGISPIRTSKYGTFIANGNTGDFLSVVDINTFHSDTAGRNITLVENKISKFDFANKGYDYVIAFETNNIVSTNVRIKDKINSIYNTEYDTNGYDFILQDTKDNKRRLSIANTERICQQDDFDKWAINSTCINGEYTSYIKKRSDSSCLIPNRYDSIFKEEHTRCICVEQDFECATGFNKTDNSCTSLDPNYYNPPFFCYEMYIIFNGVKKLDGNNCKMGEFQLNFDKSVYVCPHFITIGGISIFQILAIFVILIFLTTLLCLVKNFTKKKNNYIKSTQIVNIINLGNRI